jgi:hypothetical protein
MRCVARACCASLVCLLATGGASSLSAQPAPPERTTTERNPAGVNARANPRPDSLPESPVSFGPVSPDSSAARAELHGRMALPARRWIPRHFSIGVGGVATSAPRQGTTYSPVLGGAFDASAIGHLTPSVAWRVEGFLHLHDRSVASEPELLAAPSANRDACAGVSCGDEPRETSRRTSGAAIGLEYHPMRGRVGVYGVAMLGMAGSNSFGDAGRCHGFTPSAGLGLLVPMATDLDGFAVETRWRRIPTAVGAVNAAVVSLQLRF